MSGIVKFFFNSRNTSKSDFYIVTNDSVKLRVECDISFKFLTDKMFNVFIIFKKRVEFVAVSNYSSFLK